MPGMSDKTDKATVFEFAARYVHFLKAHTGAQYDKVSDVTKLNNQLRSVFQHMPIILMRQILVDECSMQAVKLTFSKKSAHFFKKTSPKPSVSF